MHKVINVISNGAGNFILRVERKNISFKPGQFFSLGIPSIPINREYSVSSSLNDNYLDFLIREIEDGTLSGKLRKLKKNDEIKILGPFGEFYMEKMDFTKKYIFIASGTGIAPFISIIKSNQNLDYELFHGVRNFEDAYKDIEIRNYIVFISRNKNYISKNINFKYFNGRITENLNFLENYLNHEYLYFVCGNSSMVNDIYDFLEKNKIKANKIFSELFF
jgi:ferredoxin/flavodoxin---NADP+ reductase